MGRGVSLFSWFMFSTASPGSISDARKEGRRSHRGDRSGLVLPVWHCFETQPLTTAADKALPPGHQSDTRNTLRQT